jgi:uncharacterized membrane protein
MRDLSAVNTETLQAMKVRLTNSIVYVGVIDLVAVGLFVWFATTRPPAQFLPFIPILILPGILLVPLVVRAGAVRRELERRAK